MEQYVAYYRVSTKKQGADGNGIKAQQKTVKDFLDGEDAEMFASFTEVESGGNDHRPELKQAVQLCKEEGATLLVAKLDRLSRSIKFLFTLKEELEQAGVSFHIVDLPEANNTMVLGVMATMAQHEREVIRQRISEGIRQTEKYNNDEWGNAQYFTDESRAKGRQKMKANAEKSRAWKVAFEFIRHRREQKEWSYDRIARALNKEGYRTRKNKKFYPATVRRIYLKFKDKKT